MFKSRLRFGLQPKTSSGDEATHVHVVEGHMLYAKHYLQRFTVTLCSNKLVPLRTTYRSLGIREDLCPWGGWVGGVWWEWGGGGGGHW